jgi:uncharacterized protein
VGGSLGLLGSGGSILLLPILIFLLGVPQKVAVAESLPIIAAIAAMGALPHVLARRIDWRAVLRFAPAGMLGSVVGASLSWRAPSWLQMSLLGVVVLISAWQMFRSSRGEESQKLRVVPTWLIALVGFSIGTLTGFLGVGGGFLIVPTLSLLLGLDMRRAIGTSLVLIVLNATVGAVQHLPRVTHDFAAQAPILASLILLGSAGALLGNRVGGQAPPQLLRRIFAAALIVIGLSLTASEILAGG